MPRDAIIEGHKQFRTSPKPQEFHGHKTHMTWQNCKYDHTPMAKPKRPSKISGIGTRSGIFTRPNLRRPKTLFSFFPTPPTPHGNKHLFPSTRIPHKLSSPPPHLHPFSMAQYYLSLPIEFCLLCRRVVDGWSDPMDASAGAGSDNSPKLTPSTVK